MNGGAGNLATLAILLHGRNVGALNQLTGGRFLFDFDEAYVGDATRPTLSLPFKIASGGLATDQRPTTMRPPPFFSNLLPEGPLCRCPAERASVAETREFALLSALGADLPGALTVVPADESPASEGPDGTDPPQAEPGRLLKFSLAGVQLKFSAVTDGAGHLTVPADGVGGSWIVKLPSPRYPAIAENEFAMYGTRPPSRH